VNVRYRVDLSQSERDELSALVSGGKLPARRLKRMQILLAADAGIGDEAIAASVQTSGSTIYRTKKRFVEIGLEAALSEEPRPGAARKLSGKEEVQLVALACSDAPAGSARWTLKLLANALVELIDHQSISRETIRRRLDDNDLKPWQKKMWCIAKIDADYIACMEDLLDLYAEPHDPKRPVVCFDESPIQLIGEIRVPITPKPGKRYRYDSEYKRNGTANLFVMVDANRSWRKVKVTDRRANQDFAVCMRDLATSTIPTPRRSAS
jgi:transposase